MRVPSLASPISLTLRHAALALTATFPEHCHNPPLYSPARTAVVFLNTDGFYDGLWQFYKSAMERSFISTACDSAIFIASTPEEAVSLIKAYRPVAIDKSTIYAGEMDADWTSRTQ